MLLAIENRRSIRKYKSIEVPRHMVEEIGLSGILAPSSKNRQPWKFIVMTDEAKKQILVAMRNGLQREKECPLLPNSAKHLNGAEHTLKIMEQAPVIIFIINPLGLNIHSHLTTEQHIYEICNAQSIGAAIENMTLTATELGLGSLWICDTYFSYSELRECLNVDGELFAALAIGYADEIPSPRPRKCIDDVLEWRS